MFPKPQNSRSLSSTCTARPLLILATLILSLIIAITAQAYWYPVLKWLRCPRCLTTSNDWGMPSKSLDVKPITCSSTPLQHQLRAPPSQISQSLNEYVRWHKRARLCFTNPDVPCTEKPRILLYSCPFGGPFEGRCAGIGDRLRFIRYAFLLAVATQRAFFILWPQYEGALFSLDSALAPASIDWRPPSTVIRAISDSHDLAPLLEWSSETGLVLLPRPPGKPNDTLPATSTFDIRKHSLANILPNVSIVITSRPKRSQFVQDMMLNSNIRPFFTAVNGKIKYYLFQRHLSQILFQQSASLQSYLHTIPMFDSSDHYVSVHVRTGDDFAESEYTRFQFTNLDWNQTSYKTLTCVRLHVSNLSDNFTNKAKKSDSPLQIFLASDAVLFKDLFLNITSMLSVNQHSKDITIVRTIRQKTVHFSRLQLAEFSSKDDRCRAHLNVFADLFLLGGGSAIVSTGSGFSNEAFYLSNRTKVVYLAAQAREEDECSIRMKIL